MQLAEHRPGRQPLDRDAAIALLRTAVASGINHLDTADFYGTTAANANDLIRAALHPYPEDLVLATKVGAERDATGALVPAQRPEQLRAGVEANLARLGTERLAVVNLRRVDAAPGIIAEGDQIVDLDSQLAELMALRDAGKIDGIGLSNVSVDQLRHALPAGIACVQNSHSPVDRAAEPVLDLCRKHDIAWVPFCPLGSAFPQWPKVADQPAVRDAAEALGVTSDPGRTGLASGALPAHAADRRHGRSRASRREHRRRGRTPRFRDTRRTRRDHRPVALLSPPPRRTPRTAPTSATDTTVCNAVSPDRPRRGMLPSDLGE